MVIELFYFNLETDTNKQCEIVQYEIVNKIRQCVVPENIHIRPPPPTTGGQRNCEGRGGLKGGDSRGSGGCLQRFFPGGLSKIGELFN